MNVVESPELRDLLLFIGTDLTEHDIPHRTKLSELIVLRYKAEYAKLMVEVQV